MIKRAFITLVASVWLTHGASAAVDDKNGIPSAPSDLKPILEKILSESHAPGIAALVVRGDTVVASGVAGVRKAGAAELITLQDKFHLGSNTKSMTATVAAMFVEEGKLSWSATIGDLLGDSIALIEPGWRNVTLQQVLAHRSGLRANFGPSSRELGRSRDPLPAQRLAALAAVFSQPPEYPPGTKHVYSNVGFTLVGVVLEKISGRPWEDLIRERLFVPLDLKTAGFGVPGSPGKIDQPWGHTDSGQPLQADNPALIGPAGAVHMALGDWAKYVTLHLRGDPRNPQHEARLLKAETFAQLHTPMVEGNYVCGWVCATAPAFKGDRPTDTGAMIWHNGSNTWWYAIMMLAPEADTAVVLAVNCAEAGTKRACDQVAATLLKTYVRSTLKKK